MAQTEEDFEEKDETVTQPVLHTQDKWIKFEQPKDDRVCVDPLPEPPLLSKDLSSAEYLSKLGMHDFSLFAFCIQILISFVSLYTS